LTHTELCHLTARRFGKKALVSLVEYQSYVTDEFPDVLVYNGSTTLFEIKTSRSDFLADAKKDCRIKWSPKVSGYLSRRMLTRYRENSFFVLKAERPELYYIEYPHMGLRRYYVCESGLISKEDVKNGWGLYWVKGKRFYLQKESKKFRRNVHDEIIILAHAFRKYAYGKKDQIYLGEYKSSIGVYGVTSGDNTTAEARGNRG
jgi:hypothetical protein